MQIVQSSQTSTKSAPLSWVESLFERMQAIYGNKFIDMWRDTNLDMVKALWAAEMGKLSNEELSNGYQLLMTKVWPPSLPEYVQMCKAIERKEAAHVLALSSPKSELSREKAGEMLVKLGAADAMKPKTDHKLWAKRIIEKAKKQNHGLSALQINFAKEALAA